MILNLIYGLLISIIVIITYIVGSCVNMFKKQAKYGSAIDMMADILGGSEAVPVRESEFVFVGRDGGSRDGGSRDGGSKNMSEINDGTDEINGEPTDNNIDFPIQDPELKARYTKAFLEIYSASERSPDIILDQIDNSMQYTDTPLFTPAYHIGQRKLILNEIQFLSKITNNGIIVYAGSAPSNKGAFLAYLFPHLRFIFIDPNKFEIRPYGNIEVVHSNATNDTAPVDLVDEMLTAFTHAHICTANVYMTGGIAAELGSRYVKSSVKGGFSDLSIPGFKSPIEMHFISDIRTNIDDGPPTSFDLLWNSAQHVNWVTKLEPKSSMLKFRTPFFNETDAELEEYHKKSQQEPFKSDFDAAEPYVDLRTFTERKFNYFDGEIFIQPWAPISSTESRLVFDGVPKIRAYNPSEYENKFFYYNKILRAYQYYYNPNADRKLGFDHCADCSLENQIWTEYCLSKGTPKEKIRSDIHHFIKTLSDLTYRHLLHDDHGKKFGRLPLEVILKKFAAYKPKQRTQYKPK